jgi:hypothetical protein
MAAEQPTEGWGVMRPGDRKFHYYRDTMSLCRTRGFYTAELTPDHLGEPTSDDCARCRKVLDKETGRKP